MTNTEKKDRYPKEQLPIWKDLETPYVSKQSPHKCPVCNGAGYVPPGFYNVHTTTSFNSPAELCKACGGSGVLWN